MREGYQQFYNEAINLVASRTELVKSRESQMWKDEVLEEIYTIREEHA